MEKNIAFDFLNECHLRWQQNDLGQMAANSITKNGPLLTAMDLSVPRKLPFVFSVDVWDEGVTDQGESLRCWAFASLNVVRQNVKQRLNLKERNFELSQNYIYFYDQLEKSSTFLNAIIALLDKPLTSPEMVQLLQRPIVDNGQWFTFAKLVDKYGVVPKYVMPDTQCSPDTKYVTRILESKLRLAAKQLRDADATDASHEDIYEIKQRHMAGIYDILCCFLGQPPQVFDFEYCDINGEHHCLAGITPLAFFREYGGMKTDDYMTVIHHPLPSRPYLKTYTVSSAEKSDLSKRLNLDIDTIKQLVIAQLTAGEQVVMGCDVAKQSHKPTGYMHKDLFAYEKVFGTEIEIMEKAERIRYKDTFGRHVMTFSGVSIDADGNPSRWKVHNSYGESMGIAGHYVMDDSWFDEHVLSVVINKKYASAEINQAYGEPPEQLDRRELY